MVVARTIQVTRPLCSVASGARISPVRSSSTLDLVLEAVGLKYVAPGVRAPSTSVPSTPVHRHDFRRQALTISNAAPRPQGRSLPAAPEMP